MNRFIVLMLTGAILCAAGCAKKVTKVPPAPGIEDGETLKDTIMMVAPEKAKKPVYIKNDAKPQITTGKSPEIKRTVLFGFDSDRLDGVSRETLNSLASEANGKGCRIDLKGGACPIGPEDYNEALGLRRALAVKKYLSGKVDAEFSVCSVGEKELVSTDRAEYRLNRRCEIVAD